MFEELIPEFIDNHSDSKYAVLIRDPLIDSTNSVY